VLAVTGLESETQLPYAGLHQLLQHVLESAGRLPAPQRTALLTALGMRAGTPERFLVALATLNLIDEDSHVRSDLLWLRISESAQPRHPEPAIPRRMQTRHGPPGPPVT
jgi:hypothetical protein